MKTKDTPVSVRLTEEERALLDKLARERNTTRHALLRQVVRRLVNLPTTEDILNKVVAGEDKVSVCVKCGREEASYYCQDCGKGPLCPYCAYGNERCMCIVCATEFATSEYKALR